MFRPPWCANEMRILKLHDWSVEITRAKVIQEKPRSSVSLDNSLSGGGKSESPSLPSS
jgi:hypothetical protein